MESEFVIDNMPDDIDSLKQRVKNSESSFMDYVEMYDKRTAELAEVKAQRDQLLEMFGDIAEVDHTKKMRVTVTFYHSQQAAKFADAVFAAAVDNDKTAEIESKPLQPIGG